MGDIFFNGLYPFIDTSSGGTIDGVIAAADQVLGRRPTRRRGSSPATGRSPTKADLQAYRDMLRRSATASRS